MKKKILRFGYLIILIIMLFKLQGCERSTEDYFSDNEHLQITIATGGTSGTYYPIGAAITAIISKYVPGVEAVAVSTGGSVANVKLMKNGDADLVMGAANSLYVAYNGLEPFDEAYRSLKGIAVLYPEMFHFIVLKGSGINTIYDLKGKSVAVGDWESGNRRTSKELLNIHGLTLEDIEPHYLSYREGVIALKEGQVDCVIVGAGIPTMAVVDAASEMDINLLDVDKELFTDTSKYNYLNISVIPEGTYKGVNRDVVTVASPAILATHEDMDRDIVYEITKSIFNHVDEIASAHPQGSNIKDRNIIYGMPIPLHPGAQKYYEMLRSKND